MLSYDCRSGQHAHSCRGLNPRGYSNPRELCVIIACNHCVLASGPLHLTNPYPATAGNFFFAGARTFFRSLESAIFLFSRVARIPEGSIVSGDSQIPAA